MTAAALPVATPRGSLRLGIRAQLLILCLVGLLGMAGLGAVAAINVRHVNAAAQRIDEGELARRYAALRWQRPLDFPAYAVQVGAAAAAGYAVDEGFGHAGICSIACVIPGEPIAFCLSASLFAGSRDADGIRALGRALRDLAATLGTES